jgi:type II secretory pathway pseudopilin PulG
MATSGRNISYARGVSGFSLIELLIIIIALGIMASVAVNYMMPSVEDIRRVRTEREMETLAKAIVGDPGRTQNSVRSDFGYVGDVGAFPPNLQALYENPGGLSTWDGPYIPSGYTQDSTGFKTDEWGAPYTYSGGTTITSPGGGSTITKTIADATTDYLLNTISGTILDSAGNVPGTTYLNSVDVVISFPDGSGGTANKTYNPDSTGSFILDSIPVGLHLLKIVYTPDDDTLTRYLTVLPRHRSRPSYRFASAYFTSPTAPGSMILRPDGAGSLTNLTSSGCSGNYQCVNESSSDDDATIVIRAAGSYSEDVYSLDDPVIGSGTIDSVTVYCRARKTKNQGSIIVRVYVNSTSYGVAAQNLTDSYADYFEIWTTNPATGSPWTWVEINNLQAGLRLSGQNSNWPAYCTQIWVVVDYRE